ncbi:hypothetical protein DESAMIL20_1828 [Desulfurella amilsii]|uniref:Uncharacterized protein n=1 Tax=Desulfurella amilsii TaxID=1562698 RepID=A0A1X4XXM7_9BACT|nr:hypothetical protein DESAMIL20_1828 [Desulfurella amilsii]
MGAKIAQCDFLYLAPLAKSIYYNLVFEIYSAKEGYIMS